MLLMHAEPKTFIIQSGNKYITYFKTLVCDSLKAPYDAHFQIYLSYRLKWSGLV